MVDNKALQVENNINYLQYNEISELLCKNFEQSGLELYLKEYFKDLVRRSGNENKENAISKLAFIESVKLPMIIAERLFYSFTSNRYAIEITKDQYTQGFINLYSNDIDIRMNVICIATLPYNVYNRKEKFKVASYSRRADSHTMILKVLYHMLDFLLFNIKH